MMSRAILAIDPGTKMGYAARMPCGRHVSGVMHLRHPKDTGEPYGRRFLRLRKYIQGLLHEHQPELVVYEKVRRHMGTDAAHIYGAIEAYWAEACEQKGIPLEGVPVGTIKKHATGKGNAKKADMVAAARERWPDKLVENDNEADALWILDYREAQGG